MRDWAFALMVGLIVVSVASCSAIGVVSRDRTMVEMKKLELQQEGALK